jgi:hypothetical protein
MLAETKNPLDNQVGGNHYKHYAIQPLEFFHANNIPPVEAIAIRYILRHRAKHGRQDLDKAIHTLRVLCELEYGEGRKTCIE